MARSAGGPVAKERAVDLYDRGTAAFQDGNYRAATRHFEAALAMLRRTSGDHHSDVAAALNNLGVVASHLGDYRAARRHHQEALTIRRRIGAAASLAETLNNLGAVWRALGQPAPAQACHEEALAIWCRALGRDHPDAAIALSSLGNLARERGDHETAQRHHLEALAIRTRASHPGVADSLSNLGAVATALGDHAQARSCYKQALALRRRTLPDAHPLIAETLNNVGAAARKLHDDGAARQCFEEALAIDPQLAAAHRNLAAMLAAEGRMAEARPHQVAALRRQCVFVEPAPNAEKTLLVLQSADFADVPVDHLIARHSATLIRWFIAFAAADQARRLMPYDLVFNAIGDPDLSEPVREPLARFLRVCRRPVLNPPGRVARTRRDLMPELLRDIAGIVVPDVVRVRYAASDGTDLAARARAVGILPPFLVRPAGMHGGSAVVRVETVAELANLDRGAADACYVTRYHEYRAADGQYRKYRVIFVDREPYAYHLAISDRWLVHYFSADMAATPWKLAEERRFLDDPAGTIGAAAMAAVTAIGKRLDLDYAGVDFAVLDDGRVLVFEANATMLVHAEEPSGALAYKNPSVQNILDAFEAMLMRRLRGPAGIPVDQGFRGHR